MVPMLQSEQARAAANADKARARAHYQGVLARLQAEDVQ